MCEVPVRVRELVKQRLAAAAEEVFELLERTITEYEEEIRAKLYPAGSPLFVGSTEKDPQPRHIKKEREEESFITAQEDTAPPSGQSFNDVYDKEGENSQSEIMILETYSEQYLPWIAAPLLPPTEETAPCFENPGISINALNNSYGPCMCPVCEQTFITQEQLDQHMSSHMCPMSDEELLCLHQTNNVQLSHTKKPFSCSVCGTAFSKKKHLRRHMLLIHESVLHRAENTKPFSCLLCGRGFHNERELERHTLLHSEQQKEFTVQSKRGYACTDCGRVFIYQTCLKKHTLMHEKNSKELTITLENVGNEVLCLESGKDNSDVNKCGPSGDKQQLENRKASHIKVQEKSSTSHIETHVTPRKKNERFSCSVCGLRFFTERLLAHHKARHPELRTPKLQTERRCSECGKEYYNKGSLVRHMEMHKTQMSCSCSVCGETFELEKDLEEHMSSHTPQTGVTRDTGIQTFKRGEEPDKKSTVKDVLERQNSSPKSQETEDETIAYPCLQSNKLFSQESELIKHKLMHKSQQSDQKSSECGNKESAHQTAEKIYHCKTCLLTTSNLRKFVRHRQKHNSMLTHLPKIYKCSLCPKKFCYEKSFTTHMKVHIRDEKSNGPFSCSVCGLQFYTERLLARHKSGHPELKTPKLQSERCCSECGKVYNQKATLVKHMEMHKTQMSHSCSVCGETFQTEKDLEEHMSSHTPQTDI